MRRPAALLAALLVLALPAAAQADELTVAMPGKFFEPARSTIVAGDRVTFRNADLVTHDVRVGGGVFDSGLMLRNTIWAQGFDAPGEYPFVCTLHRFMSGTLTVVAATLDATPAGVLAGRPLKLSGRAPAGTAQLTVERSDGAGGWVGVGTVVPEADGTYAATTPAVEGATYRVTGAAGPSPMVVPQVTAKVDLHLTLDRGRRHTTLAVHAMPAPAGMVATLELYARWRYRWHPVQTIALDRAGRARFRIPATRRTYARVSLRQARGPALVHSHVLRTSDGRSAPDPDTIRPPGTGGGEHGGGGHGGH